ncbi:MAG: hypothetical protein LBC67_04335 [Spirochaetales bacterium]|jgi:hypothetical protein|nr:hypothetical protein [Spirochaetales bacterium]
MSRTGSAQKFSQAGGFIVRTEKKPEGAEKAGKDGRSSAPGKGPGGVQGAERTALIRKGNELYNNGNFSLAERIFITTGYSDGLIRMGDYHYKKNEYIEALDMYLKASDKAKSGQIIERMVFVIREWLSGGDA